MPSDPNIVVLRGRLSFPVLNERTRLDEEQKRKKFAKAGEADKEQSFGLSVLIDKEEGKDIIARCREAIARVAAEAWKGKTVSVKGQSEKIVSQADPKAEKVVLIGTALHDGKDKEDKDGYGDHIMYVSANRPKSKGPPRVCDKKFEDIRPEESHYPYAGCYVQVSVRFWPQDNDFGKRVNAELRAVIFDKHGEPFGAAPVSVEEDFAGLDLSEEEHTPAKPVKGEAKAAVQDDDDF
jgi:hypothetical protein